MIRTKDTFKPKAMAEAVIRTMKEMQQEMLDYQFDGIRIIGVKYSGKKTLADSLMPLLGYDHRQFGKDRVTLGTNFDLSQPFTVGLKIHQNILNARSGLNVNYKNEYVKNLIQYSHFHIEIGFDVNGAPAGVYI